MSKPFDRKSALRHLIEYRLPLEPALVTLSECPWDVPKPVTVLHLKDIDAILTRFLNGQMSSEQLTDWADLLECRDDIGMSEHEEMQKEIIFRLANPNLAGAVSREVVIDIQKALRRAETAA